jgi:hypothetical protein
VSRSVVCEGTCFRHASTWDNLVGDQTQVTRNGSLSGRPRDRALPRQVPAAGLECPSIDEDKNARRARSGGRGDGESVLTSREDGWRWECSRSLRRAVRRRWRERLTAVSDFHTILCPNRRSRRSYTFHMDLSGRWWTTGAVSTLKVAHSAFQADRGQDDAVLALVCQRSDDVMPQSNKKGCPKKPENTTVARLGLSWTDWGKLCSHWSTRPNLGLVLTGQSAKVEPS